jgi:hypothetical protein
MTSAARLRARLPRGARTVPPTPWSASGSRWRAKPSTYAVLAGGLWIFGTGEAAMVDAGIGVSPWTVLAEGIGEQTGASIGLATFAASLVVLLAWIPLRERPGLGTLANAAIIAVAIDAMRPVLPDPDAAGAQLAQVLAGIACIGVGSGLYLTANLGPGPRDGLMTGLNRRLGVPVGRVRMAIELSVLVVGWLLGGTVGLGTVLFALLVGYAVSLGLGLAGRAGGMAARPPGPSA